MSRMRLDDEISEIYSMMREALISKGDIPHAEFFYKRLRKEFCIDIIPEIALQWPYRMVHPLGSVLGRATYASHMVFYQGVSVGSTLDKERPTFLGPCVLFPRATVIGPVTIGKNVYITAGTIIEGRADYKWNIPDNSVVYRSNASGGFSYSPTQRSVIADFFPELRKPTPESLAALGVEGYV